MALRKGLGGCWAEGDSLSGMAVHYTMVTRSGLGSRGPLLLTSGHWWLVAGWCSGGGALVRESRVSTWLLGAHCGYLFCCRCHPRTLSMSPHSAVTRLGSLLATLPAPSLYLCPGCHCVCILLQCSVWMLPGARCLANYRSMSQSYIPLRRPARPSPAWATDRPVSARGAAARPATSHQGGAGRGGAGRG